MAVVTLLFLSAFLLPLLFGVIGLARSPSRRLAGALYWIAFGLVSAQMLSYEVMIGFDVFQWGRISSRPLGWSPLFLIPLPVILLLLTSNTLWVMGQERRIPSDAGDEESSGFRSRLKRRLWFPLLAMPLLQLALSFILSAVVTPSRSVRRPPPKPAAGPPTATSGLGQTSPTGVRSR